MHQLFGKKKEILRDLPNQMYVALSHITHSLKEEEGLSQERNKRTAGGKTAQC